MRRAHLLDTGPLVAFLNRREADHDWAKQALAAVPPPMLTCEAVLTEACYLLRETPGGATAVLDLVKRGLVRLPFRLEDEVAEVGRLMTKYASVPMSLADSCLVRMSETISNSVLLTLDGDFRVYRRHGRLTIPTIMPRAM